MCQVNLVDHQWKSRLSHLAKTMSEMVMTKISRLSIISSKTYHAKMKYITWSVQDKLNCITNNHSQHEDLYGDKGSFDKSCLKNISCEAHFSWDFGSKSFLAFKLQYFQSRSTPGQVFKARVEIEITFTLFQVIFPFQPLDQSIRLISLLDTCRYHL